MKGTLLTMKGYYLKHAYIAHLDDMKIESFNKFYYRMHKAGIIKCGNRTAYNHYKEGYGYLFTSNNTTIHLSEVRK